MRKNKIFTCLLNCKGHIPLKNYKCIFDAIGQRIIIAIYVNNCLIITTKLD